MRGITIKRTLTIARSALLGILGGLALCSLSFVLLSSIFARESVGFGVQYVMDEAEARADAQLVMAVMGAVALIAAAALTYRARKAGIGSTAPVHIASATNVATSFLAYMLLTREVNMAFPRHAVIAAAFAVALLQSAASTRYLLGFKRRVFLISAYLVACASPFAFLAMTNATK
ncbi:MAG: hypothetical protein FWE70_08640 [Oscillospiraceae bacterium]|nr:hypothetical protein [Oscillospiraceae bacterium]